MIHTGRWVRAWKRGKFRPPLVSQGGTCLEEWFPFMEETERMDPSDLYEMLNERLNKDPKPSWRAVQALATFMDVTFTRFGAWEVPQNFIAAQTWGAGDETYSQMFKFKHVCIDLLLATAADFTTRNVPRPDKMYAADEDLPEELVRTVSGRVVVNPDAKSGAGMVRVLSDLSAGDRTNSSNVSGNAMADAMVEAAANEPLVRANTGEMVDRFAHMLSWENSEHPICVFKSGFGDTVNGIEVLSLNPRFLDQYIDRGLKQALETQQLELSKDWTKLKNEEAEEMLRSVEGFGAHSEPGMEG